MIKVGVSVKGLDATLASLAGKAKQVRFAAAKAVNATAKKVVEAEAREIGRVFQGPVKATRNAVVVKKYADKGEVVISAIVAIDDGVRRSAAEASFDAARLRQGKNTIPPAKYLLPQIVGGVRVAKRHEVALQKKGLMPAGMVAVFARRSGYLDASGNLPGPKIVQILAWFQAFPEQGYRQNMKAGSKKNLTAGRRKGMKWGFAYFRGGRDTGLPDGIWERHYPNGQSGKSFVKPVLVYVKAATYRPRFAFAEIAEKTIRSEWAAQWDLAFGNAMRTAR